MNNINSSVSLIMQSITQEILDNTFNHISNINWNLDIDDNCFNLTLIVNTDNKEHRVTYKLEKDKLNDWKYIKHHINNYCADLGWLD